MKFSKCTNLNCVNHHKVATHPRNNVDPKKCGLCGFDVIVFESNRKQSNKDEYDLDEEESQKSEESKEGQDDFEDFDEIQPLIPK